jgi:diaminobutyrate-2-oxoglutarate transaminase
VRVRRFSVGVRSLNYGHNHPALKRTAIDYLLKDGIAASLDFHTEAKLGLIEAFESKILSPRGMRYRMQFPGPTGASCVEAALKLARKATGRMNVVAFTNAFHGVSAGALAVTGSAASRKSAQGTLGHVTRIPYDGYLGPTPATLHVSKRWRRIRPAVSIP